MHAFSAKNFWQRGSLALKAIRTNSLHAFSFCDCPAPSLPGLTSRLKSSMLPACRYYRILLQVRRAMPIVCRTQCKPHDTVVTQELFQVGSLHCGFPFNTFTPNTPAAPAQKRRLRLGLEVSEVMYGHEALTSRFRVGRALHVRVCTVRYCRCQCITLFWKDLCSIAFGRMSSTDECGSGESTGRRSELEMLQQKWPHWHA